MKLMTKDLQRRLEDNHRLTQRCNKERGSVPDHKPVLKVFNPSGAAVWLFTEFDGDDTLFGLCDLGMGCPEVGYASLKELESLKGPLGLPMERDRWFKASKTLNQYREDAALAGRVRA